VACFILRGVCLYGIASVMCPISRWREAWKRLENDLDRQKLASMTQEIDLSGVRRRRRPSSPARCAGESWSKSGKRVQDLSTNGGYIPEGLKNRPQAL